MSGVSGAVGTKTAQGSIAFKTEIIQRSGETRAFWHACRNMTTGKGFPVGAGIYNPIGVLLKVH